ncbi:MAG: CPBP family intramembrane metalloprotease [Bacteroidaceae bacterium]|nr:CPBP family intramembrane metalloprotease [Bacteroidaceae bacterium]
MKNNVTSSKRGLLASVLVCASLWFVMFSPWTAHAVNFWAVMSMSGVLLTALATFVGRDWYRGLAVGWDTLLWGVAIAVLLWGAFFVGDKLSQLLFGFAREQVDAIYGMKEGESPIVVGLLLLLVIGPAEEVFWRGYLQKSLAVWLGADRGFLLTLALYTLVHVWSFNFMLIMAAMVCGAAWGLLYRLKPDHLPALILSHALWDVAAFVVFPF